MTEQDPNSFANTHELITRELYMNLTADFSRSIFKGYVVITAEALSDGVKELVLDTRDLAIFKVRVRLRGAMSDVRCGWCGRSWASIRCALFG